MLSAVRQLIQSQSCSPSVVHPTIHVLFEQGSFFPCKVALPRAVAQTLDPASEGWVGARIASHHG